ncbi:MAG: DegT/DnrJ/EryC1/StrS family aminotransferase [Thermodesulfobacteriota bacterium]
MIRQAGDCPVRTRPFPPYHTLDENEERAVVQVIRDGVISDFIGAKGPFFMGGKKVQELEDMYRRRCGVKHAVAMNSATSVIIAAMGAFGIGPGDEVIVTPYSHVISATAPLLYDAVPVFADSEPDTFCMSPRGIEERITPRTKAIIVVDLFGQSADMDPIMELAQRHNLFVFSDSAHITKARYKDRMAGTLAHIGSYSLNGHKTVQCGEGGVAVTDDDELAFKLQLIRNHAENCVAAYNVDHYPNMLGYNFRMTELEAAVAVEQLKKADRLVEDRRALAAYLDDALTGLAGITVPKVRDGCTHDYLIYPLLYDRNEIGLPRDEFLRRLDAEGINTSPVGEWHVPPVSTFVKPIHLQPIFQKRHFRPGGHPWRASYYQGQVCYEEGICPVVEDLWRNSLICFNAIYPPLTTADMDDVAAAFRKVAASNR